MDISDEVIESFFKFKSSAVYQKWISSYKTWIAQNNKEENVDTVLEFLSFLSESYSPSTLWHVYAILNKYFKVYKGLNLNNCELLRDFLKAKGKTHAVKKSDVFTEGEIDDFLNFQDNDDNITFKIILILGIHGLLRYTEITELQFADIKKVDDNNEVMYKVIIRTSKTDQAGNGFFFFVVGKHVSHIDKYISCFELKNRNGRFLRKIVNGKGTNRVIGNQMSLTIGKNSVGDTPYQIATFLKLPNKERFSGHCLRKTGATLLADKGADKIVLKRAGRWKSDTVCEGYINESLKSKVEISKKLNSNKLSKNVDDKYGQKNGESQEGDGKYSVYNISLSGFDGQWYLIFNKFQFSSICSVL
jgi:integrase